MKTLFRACVLLSPFGLSFTASLLAQAVSPAPAASSASGQTAGDDAVILSPFEVSTGPDEGYAARETLAGTRFKSELKDVPSQVSIMTKEFLDDIASVTMEDAFRYSANIENTTEFTSATTAGGDFNTGVLNTRDSGRIRGLTAPGITHDFFQTNLMQDSYNIERLSISSGPNAILFGNGNPGGIVDTAFVRANVQRPRYQVSLRTDNYGSLRGSVDLNQPFVKNVFGLRFAALKSHQNHWREPGGREDSRYFGTFTLKPTKTTTIRAYYEDSMVDQTTPRNVRFGDQVTPWINAGRPAFNNGLDNPSVVDASNSGIFARNTSTRNVLILGAAADDPYMIWGSGGGVNIALPTTRYSVNTIGPGSTPNQVGVDSHIYSLPNNEAISPFDVSVNGNGTRNLTYGKIWGAAIEQRLPGNVFVQLDHNREKVKQPIADFVRGIQSAVRADANMYLPDRVTPNPNFGRYYVEGQPRVFSFRSESEESRAMVSYELDLTVRDNWTKWFGRHRMAAMYQRSESMGVQQESVPRIIPAGTSFAAALDGWGGPAFNTFSFRTYLSDPTDSSTGSTYHVTLPFDPLRTTTYTMPDGGTYVAGYKNPYGGNGAAQLVNNLAEGRVFALQNFFLQNRLVTSFGWRHDSIRQATRVLQRKTAAGNSAFESIHDFDPPQNWTEFRKGDTNTQGAVLHILPRWVSVFYNQSSTWNPPTGLINPDDGTQIPGATGDGKDYGIMLRLLDNRISLRLNKYENTSGPASNNAYRNAIIPVVQNIENTLIDRTDDGTVNVPRPQFYDPEQGTYTLSGLHSDLVSKGYEAEIVANPLRNWRLSLSGAKSTATASNIGRSWVNFISQRASVWAANSTLTGPGEGNTTIASRYLNIIQVLNQMAEADGQKVENGREWRVNLVTRYAFSEGVLRGAFVGTGYRWRSPQVIGYRAALVTNKFPLPGAPAEVLVPSREAPIEGKVMAETELFFGYSRRIGKRVNWRAQLNIRNVFDNEDRVQQRANISEGFVTVYSVPEPRSFILTNTFSF